VKESVASLGEELRCQSWLLVCLTGSGHAVVAVAVPLRHPWPFGGTNCMLLCHLLSCESNSFLTSVQPGWQTDYLRKWIPVAQKQIVRDVRICFANVKTSFDSVELLRTCPLFPALAFYFKVMQRHFEWNLKDRKKKYREFLNLIETFTMEFLLLEGRNSQS
jgi:hypothetical protein